MEENEVPSDAILEHYASLAGSYDILWEHTTGFKTWMTRRIIEFASMPPAPLVADVGGGTGIYAQCLVDELDGHASIVVVDPSAEMLAQVPRSDAVCTAHASAEETVELLTELGFGAVDLVLIKEAVHHFADPRLTLGELSTLLRPGGVLMVVMLPQRIEYPLFEAALRRFESLQPDPLVIQECMTAAGLETTRHVRGFDLNLPTERWLRMVSGRFMSLLSLFDDEEIQLGIREVQTRLGDAEEVSFKDNFEFVIGRCPAT